MKTDALNAIAEEFLFTGAIEIGDTREISQAMAVDDASLQAAIEKSISVSVTAIAGVQVNVSLEIPSD